MRDEPQRQRRVRELARRVRRSWRERGFEIPPGDSPIVPIILGDEAAALDAAERLLRRRAARPRRPPADRAARDEPAARDAVVRAHGRGSRATRVRARVSKPCDSRRLSRTRRPRSRVQDHPSALADRAFEGTASPTKRQAFDLPRLSDRSANANPARRSLDLTRVRHRARRVDQRSGWPGRASGRRCWTAIRSSVRWSRSGDGSPLGIASSRCSTVSTAAIRSVATRRRGSSERTCRRCRRRSRSLGVTARSSSRSTAAGHPPHEVSHSYIPRSTWPATPPLTFRRPGHWNSGQQPSQSTSLPNEQSPATIPARYEMRDRHLFSGCIVSRRLSDEPGPRTVANRRVAVVARVPDRWPLT